MDSKESKQGCFAWLIRVKKSIDERAARFRNALRKRLARENILPRPLTPDDLENETGTPDLVITRVKVSPKSPAPAVSPLPGVPDSPPPVAVGSSDGRCYIKADIDGNPDTQQVKDFVMGIVQSAVEEIKLRDDGCLDTHNITDDTASITSSVLSEMADAAVRQSLTNVVRELTVEPAIVADDRADSPSFGA